MAHDHHLDIPIDSFRLPSATWTHVRNVLVATTVVGWGACLAGYLQDHDQFSRSYLVAFLATIFMALGGMLFVMIQHLTNSAWSVTVRRFMESLMMSLPVGAILFIPIALNVHSLYVWSLPGGVAHFSGGKASYLNERFFVIRAFIYFLIWTALSWRLWAISRKQDETKSASLCYSAAKVSAPGVFFLFITATLAAFDWNMSINPHWYSTIYGVYCITGGAWGFFACLILICMRLRANGILTHSITVEHYHDLGKWQFALTAFWAYIAFSQYMLIWYANMPEETIYYKVRMEGTWRLLTLALPLIHFIFPFFLLIARPAKRTLSILSFISVYVLIVHYLDVYWMIMPNYAKSGIQFHWMDLAALVAVVGTFGFFFWQRLKDAPIVPEGDPRLAKSLRFHNV